MEFRALDLYCERLSAAFWAEPANALSNLAFVFVGVWALWQGRKLSARPMVMIMAGLIVAVGIGSFLFHTYANTLALIGDLVPIFVFTSAYLFHSLRRFIQWPLKRSLVALVAVVAGMALAQIFVPNHVLNGSLLYAPPLLALFCVAGAMRARHHGKWSQLYAAGAATLALSLVMRTLDPVICDAFPLGTHFLWHLLNGACLGILITVALRFDPAPTGAG